MKEFFRKYKNNFILSAVLSLIIIILLILGLEVYWQVIMYLSGTLIPNAYFLGPFIIAGGIPIVLMLITALITTLITSRRFLLKGFFVSLLTVFISMNIFTYVSAPFVGIYYQNFKGTFLTQNDIEVTVLEDKYILFKDIPESVKVEKPWEFINTAGLLEMKINIKNISNDSINYITELMISIDNSAHTNMKVYGDNFPRNFELNLKPGESKEVSFSYTVYEFDSQLTPITGPAEFELLIQKPGSFLTTNQKFKSKEHNWYGN